MPDGPAALRLTIVDRASGGTVEQRVVLPVVLGRLDGPGVLALPDPEVSRRHAQIDRAGDEIVLTDLGSANGTYVNGERITRHPLGAGDVLRLGRFELRWAPVGPPPADVTSIAGSAAATSVGLVVAPARAVLQAAAAYRAANGHELDGFLSTEHGFVPTEPPLLSLPESHKPWDDMVDQLPGLFRRLDLRRAFDHLPLLDATPDALPDRYLLRASTLLGSFAHSYQYMATDPPEALPPGILRPWQQVSQRLGKDLPSVSYTDLFLYNWKLKDPAGPRRLDNLELLVPTWGNPAERVFYLVTTEFAMALAPLLEAMVTAQEAALAEDTDGVARALHVILGCLDHATQVIYPQIDPNPYSRSHLDQVLWAKTVGTAGVPIFDGAPSPSGTAQPQIHALDAFLERREYGSLVGRQSTYLGGHFPRFWKEVVEALRAVSVRSFVERHGRSDLRGLYNAVLESYVGDRGWMGLHRIKAYGFLEVSFTVGRSVTTGARFTGLFKDKTWDKVDAELATVRDERRPPVGSPVAFGKPRPGRVTTAPDGSWTCRVELDVSGQGVHHHPGDRVGVLAENDDEIVRRTIRALQATGDELVALNPAWRDAIRLRWGYSADTAVLPLRTVLAFARLRPMERGTAKRLLGLSGSGALRRVVDARMEDQWELWDVLGLLHAGGFDVTRLWTAEADDPDSFCAIVPPESFRLYSIASATAPGKPADVLRLVVAGMEYRSARTPWSYPHERRGTASHFLRRVATEGRYRTRRVSLRIVAAPRFRLPTDGSPVVMFAAGSGIAPFRGFAEAGVRGRLYVGARTPEDFAGGGARGADQTAELREAFAGLEVHAAFSRADSALAPDLSVVPGTRRRIGALIAEHADGLRDLLERGAHVYICGSTRFAASVTDALAALADIRQLTASGRLQLDVFTTYGGHAQEGTRHEISDLVTRNTDRAGQWMAIDGKVYDVTEFAHLHVGGPDIVKLHAGMDATDAYRQVLHHAHPEIDSLLGMYEIGVLRRLAFGDRWGVVLGAEGLRFLWLRELFTAWVRALYLVVGMENALRSDYGFLRLAATHGEAPADLTGFKTQFALETHRRFLVSYLDGLTGEELPELWAATVGFCAPALDVRWPAPPEVPEHRIVRNTVVHLKGLLARVADGGDGAALRTVQQACGVLVREDARVLAELKEVLRAGVRAFEEHEENVVERAGDRLVGGLRSVAGIVTAYEARLAAAAGSLGLPVSELAAAISEEVVPADRGVPGHGDPMDLRE
jgi:cytochrome b involved in lipid metabolism